MFLGFTCGCGSETLLIKTQLYVEDVNSINALDMDFRLDFFLWHQWNVTGNFCLTYETNVKKLGLRKGWKEISEKVTVSKNHFTFFWIPDTYIVNAKSVETPSKVTSTQVLTINKFHDTCIMEYTARFAAVVGCQMEFKHYPVDIQKCPVTFRSYSYPMDTVHYEWVDKDSSPLKNPHLKLLQHNLDLKKLQFTVETLNVKYSCIAVMFILERQISHHLMQVFAPSAMIVMLSWFSFWIGIDAIPGRVTLVVTSLLSLFTQFSGIRGGLPPASYINGIDIWMATCMLFVFCSFAEFVLVKYFDKQRQVFFQQQRKQTLTPLLVSDMEKGQSQVNLKKPRSAWTIPATVQDNFPHNWFKHPSWSVDWVVTIDHAARIIFPVAFLIFNTFYWPVLLTRMY